MKTAISRFFFKRSFSSLKLSEELKWALQEKKPIVSLESTIITHGLPYPQNLQMAKRVEQEIRTHGAIPATTAFINGVPKVGLTDFELEMLANSSNATKVSRRDIPYVMSQNLNGGTTISGTMILSNRAGIKVFATGGLGGVHRDGENTMDISADLDELGKTPVAVVCAGPKSILDIERTMEYLETKGVFVGTYGPEGTNVPGFYTRDSGVASVYNFQDFQMAANIIKQGESLQLNSGLLFCIPPPKEIAMDGEFINKIIDQANYDAVKLGIKGKKITPFMLSRIAEATKGESVKTNIEFVLNNARAATNIAIEYSKLNGGNVDSTISLNPYETKPSTTAQSMVIGSVALDTSCLSNSKTIVLNDSNPSTIKSSIGGVGFNVAMEAIKSGNDSLKFVSSVGDDAQGDKILKSIDMNHAIEVQHNSSTSQYISFHDGKGDLVVAAADMGIIETISNDHIEKQVKDTKPAVLLMDANILSSSMQKIMNLSQDHSFKVIFEPTSSPKAKRLSEVELKPFPECSILLSTPTLAELRSIYDSFEESGKFELDNWFPIIDALGVDKTLKHKVESASMRNPFYKSIIKDGILQTGVSLLPFIKHLVIKDGANGVFHLSIHEDIQQITPNPAADLSLSSKGQNNLGVLLEHYSVPSVLDNLSNVTGAGDALAGSLLSALSVNSDVLSSDKRHIVIEEAQEAAARKLRSHA